MSEVIRRRERTSGTRSVSGQAEDDGREGKMKSLMEVRKTESRGCGDLPLVTQLLKTVKVI